MGSKKLNIAIFIDSDLHSGGGYQYEYMVMDGINKHHKDNSISFKYYGLKESLVESYKRLDLDIKIIKENILQKIHRTSLTNIYWYKIFSKLKMKFCSIEKQLLDDDIDLVYFLSPNLVSQGLSNIPYIFTLWDLGHLDVLEFPEVSYDRKFELRELVYTKSLKKAFKVIVDSNYEKEYAIKKYNLDDKRVEVFKFLPNIWVEKSKNKIDIKEKYNLKNNYIFYPAQFWAHKNHVYILKAIKILKEEFNIDIEVVFSGSDQGNLGYILDTAREYRVIDLVHYIGFVPNEDIPSLYKQSLSLVMPTYLGPTNIPPFEAFAYETPVCYSDMPFFREQVGDAAFFIDLNNPNSLVKCLLKIMKDKDTVEKKMLIGKQILNNWNDCDFYNKLIQVFKEYRIIRQTWK